MEQVPEKVLRRRDISKAYRERNKEKERERSRKVAEARRNSNREAYNAYMREWTAKNKDRVNAARRDRLKTDTEYAKNVREKERKRYADNPEKHKDIRLKSIYGISLKEYKDMYDSQDGKCAICGTHKPSYGKGGLSVDHCHKTGKVRKLLCTPCNAALGKFKDNVQNLENAVKYLLELI